MIELIGGALLRISHVTDMMISLLIQIVLGTLGQEKAEFVLFIRSVLS